MTEQRARFKALAAAVALDDTTSLRQIAEPEIVRLREMLCLFAR
jgi:hypothetical protein